MARSRSQAPSPARRPRVLVAFLVIVATIATITAPSASAKLRRPTHRWDPRVEPIAHAVEKLRGGEFFTPIEVHFLSDVDFDERLTGSRGSGGVLGADALGGSEYLRTLALFGLIDRAFEPPTARASVQGVLGYFNPFGPRIVIRGRELDGLRKYVLAHELAHALHDQEFGQYSVYRGARTTAAQTAAQALEEGDAERVAALYLRTVDRADKHELARGLAALEQRADVGIDDAFPEIYRVLADVPYLLGRIATEAIVAARGERELDRQFRKGPADDATVTNPLRALRPVRATKVSVRLERGEIRDGSTDRWGPAMLYYVLASRIDPALALAAADAWSGDSVVTFVRGATYCARVALAGSGPTDPMRRAFDAFAAAMPAGAVTVAPGTRSAPNVVVTVCDGRAQASAPRSLLAAHLLLAMRNTLEVQAIRNGYSTETIGCIASGYTSDGRLVAQLATPSDARSTEDLQALVADLAARTQADCHVDGRHRPSAGLTPRGLEVLARVA